MTTHGRRHDAAPGHDRAPINARLAVTLGGVDASLNVIAAQQMRILDLTRQLLQQRAERTRS